MKPGISLAFLFAFLLMLSACTGASQPGGTNVWIDVPTSNLTFKQGEPINIEGYASSPEGINRVEILVDTTLQEKIENLSQEGRLSSFQTSWTPTKPGVYVIFAVAYGVNGGTSEPDSTTIIVGDNTQAQNNIIITPTTKITPTIEISLTPTLTSTMVPETAIQFWADPASIKAGSCTTLQWRTENVQKVIFGGIEQPFSGKEQVCLCKSASYPLTITLLDGTIAKPLVNIEVIGMCETPVASDTTAPPAPDQAVPSDGQSITCKSSQSLVWLPVSDPSGIGEYQVQTQRSSDQATWKTAPGSPVNGIKDKKTTIPVECGWYYRWKVRAIDGKGNVGPWSGWSRFSITLN
jgi:hypothetical protein